jgi:putative glycosyltransferase (TIGR04348 family)
MKIVIVTPPPPGSRKGNRISALRWARLLRELGHRVAINQVYQGEAFDVLIALHARRSAAAVQRFRSLYPGRPLILLLTGTDLYGDIRTDEAAQTSLELASRLVVLQPLGIDELPAPLRAKTRVIYQSMPVPPRHPAPRRDSFEVCVLGHLRPVKDPFRTALASRLLPESSRLRVLHLGAALSPEMARRARREMAVNARYRWLGDVPRWKALRILARCRLLVQTSLLEGGANTISEAIVAGVPVVSSRIAGSIGLLGADYPGYFPVGDTRALAQALYRAETESRFYEALRSKCRKLAPRFEPARERAALERLLCELAPGLRVPRRTARGNA